MRFCAKKGNLWLCKMMLIPRNVEPFPKEATNGAPATRSRCHQSQYLLPPHLSFSLRPACYEPLRLRIHLATKDLHKREVYNDSYKDKHQLLRSSCKQLWPTTWTIPVTRVSMVGGWIWTMGRVTPYMQKAGDSWDISPQIFLDYPQNFRLRTRNQYCTQAIAWGSTI